VNILAIAAWCGLGFPCNRMRRLVGKIAHYMSENVKSLELKMA
jgi:hypothetical protein